MTPEQEAELRARMAAARSDVDGPTIDLDEPTPMPGYDPSNPYGTLIRPGVERAMGHGAQGEFHKPNLDMTPEQIDHYQRMNLRAAPLMGGAYLAGSLASYGMREAMERPLRAMEQKDKEESLGKQEETIKKAMENAKRIAAAKARQEKATKDRDEAIESGSRGYRVERALYPSDLHRK